MLDVKERRHWIDVLGEYRTEEVECPRCGRPAWQVHQRHLQRKRDARLWRKPVWLARLRRAETALPLPELPQSVHGTRPSLRGAKANDGQAEGYRSGMGERGDGESSGEG